jgi:hypothetical protein
MLTRTPRGSFLVMCLVLAGCSNPPAPSDGGGATDAFAPPIDGNGADVNAPPVDAFVPPVDAPGTDAGMAPASVAERARAIATTLRGTTHFLVGMGNDLDGAPTYDPDRAGVYTLGTTLDIHYTYLNGYSDRGGWSTWNPNGTFATILADACQRNGGLAPMFSYYQLALEYENGNDVLRDPDRMHVYLSDVRLLFQRLGEYGHPALVQFEPDFFGYLQNRLRMMGTTPDAYSAELHFADVPECASVPNTAAGLVECFVRMRDALAPMTLLGLHASSWGDYWDDTSASPAEIETHAQGVAAFLTAMRADLVEFVTVEALDRDAGFWETNGGMAGMCSITMGSRGAVYWDETNATRPNFSDHLHWVSALTTAVGRPALWWQIPFGVPATTCGGVGGGSDGHWRDDRVHYFFAHPGELVAAGAFGMVFGTGADRQTDWTTDGNAFHDAANAYTASPTALP